PAGQQLTKYVNGAPVGSQSLSGGVDGRYALGPAASLFTAGISAGGFTRPGFVSSIQFINGLLSPGTLAGLGGPTAAKIPPGIAVVKFVGVSLSGSALTLDWVGPSGQFQVQGTTSLDH